MNVETIHKKLTDISSTVFRETSVLFAYLYGSIAADQPHPSSDLDIAVFVDNISPKEGLQLELELGLKIDEALQIGFLSDVRILNFLPILIAGKIITEGRLFYCADDEKRVDYETRTRSAYFDFHQFILRYQNEYMSQLVESFA